MTWRGAGQMLIAAGVLITATLAGARDVQVRLYSAMPPEQIRVVARDATWKKCEQCKPEKIAKELVIRAAGARVVVGTRTETAQMYLAGPYELRVANRGALEMRVPMRVSAAQGKLVLIATTPLEEYVAAVVAGEAGGIASNEALKAAAVAARTYAIKFPARHKSEGFELCDSTHCQNARFGESNERVRNAVAQTAGELLWYRGAPAASYYSRNCGGRTEDAREVWPDMPAAYLVSHDDPYCSGSADSSWETTISGDEISRVLATLPHAPAQARDIRVERRTASGRNSKLRISARDGRNYVVDEQTFRTATGRVLGWNRIRSDQFDVGSTSAGFRFAGRGAGHGVGICQRGAANMGQQGKSYREILAFYYPGTKVGLTAQGTEWKFSRGERLDMLSTHADDSQVLELGERVATELERSTGMQFASRLPLRVYPTAETFRDGTGEPGWVAASTKGNTIRLQPAAVLRQRGVLQATLRHELLHVLIESHAKTGTPVWFREGLVLQLSGARVSAGAVARSRPELLDRRLTTPASAAEMRAAYDEALRRTSELISRHGREAVLSWLEKGIPEEISATELR